MARCRKGMFDDAGSHPKRGLTPSRGKPSSVVRAMAKSLDVLASGPAPQLTPSVLTNADGPSIAPKILAFATREAANSPGGRSCAKLYLALQGMAVPLRHTTTGMDLTRLEWWLQAMAEHATGRWGGNADGVRAIAGAQPEIWEQTQAATRAWERPQGEPDGGGHSPTAIASSCPDANANVHSSKNGGA